MNATVPLNPAPQPMPRCELSRIVTATIHFLTRLSAVADRRFSSEFREGDEQLVCNLAFSGASVHCVTDQLVSLHQHLEAGGLDNTQLLLLGRLLKLCLEQIRDDSRNAELNGFSQTVLAMLVEDIRRAVHACADGALAPCPLEAAVAVVPIEVPGITFPWRLLPVLLAVALLLWLGIASVYQRVVALLPP